MVYVHFTCWDLFSFFHILSIYRLNLTFHNFILFIFHKKRLHKHYIIQRCGEGTSRSHKACTRRPPSQQIAILGSKYPFSLCWGKRTFSWRKRKHIFILPFLFFISYLYYRRLINIFILYYSLLFYCAFVTDMAGWVVLRQCRLLFFQYPPAYKKKSEDWRQNFYYWANGAFFYQRACVGSVRHSEANAIWSATTKHPVI